MEVINELQWEAPYYTYKGEKIIPNIWDGEPSDCPKEFNSLTIKLDGRVQSNLDWSHAREQAQKAVQMGNFIFWDFDLGLFEALPHALIHQSQYLSLGLSLQHFKDTLWNEFKENTLGVCFYRGGADFSAVFPWDDKQLENFREWLKHTLSDEAACVRETGVACQNLEQANVNDFQTPAGKQLVRLFCQDVAMEYVSLLAAQLPDSLPAYLLLDTASVSASIDKLQILHPEKFEFVRLGLRGCSLPLTAWGWGQPSSWGYIGHAPQAEHPSKEISIGLCLPPPTHCRPSQWTGIDKALTLLNEYDIPFKIIGEGQLLTSWEGLDYLIYSPSGLSVQGKRQFLGFCAAGGTVVSLGALLDFPYEEPFDQWITRYK